ncbi:MAG TPA: AsmA-like C-terminal region-containing protein [archaeon]|nr:AsmA-like C-terminal region-containing protein [archaeon]
MNKKVFKVLGIAALALAFLFGALALGLKMFFPAQAVKEIIETRVSEQLGRQTRIGDISLSILRGFALDLRNFEIAGDQPSDSIPFLLRGDRLLLRLRLLPLFRRRIEIVSLRLIRPEVYLVKDESGNLNTSRLFPKEEKPAPREPGKFSLRLIVIAAEMEGGSLHYLDRVLPLDLTLNPVNMELYFQEGRGSSAFGLSGELEIEGLETSGSLQNFVRAMPLRVEFSATQPAESGDFLFDKIGLSFAGLELGGEGRLSGLSGETPGYAFSLSGETKDLERLLKLLPPEAGKAVKVEKAEGLLRLSVKFEGRKGDEESPLYEVKASLSNGKAKLDGLPEQIEELNTSVTLKKGELLIESLSARLGKNRVSLDGRLGLIDGYPYDCRVKGSFSLDNMAKSLFELQNWDAGGTVEADLELNGRFDDFSALLINGKLGGREIWLARPGDEFRLAAPKIELAFAGRNIERLQIELASRETRLTASGRIENYLSLFPIQENKTIGPPRWKLNLAGAQLNLQDIIPLSSEDKDLKGKSEESFTLPMRLGTGSGEIKVGKFSASENFSLDSLEASFRVADSLLYLERIKAKLFSGSLSGQGSAVFSEGGPPSYALDFETSDVRVGQALSPLTSFGKYLSGNISSRFHLTGSGATAESFLKALAAQGEFTISRGELTGSPLLESLAGVSKISEWRDKLLINEWVGNLSIGNERVFTDNLEIKAANGDWNAAGSFGFDGSLDYSLGVALDNALTRKYSSVLPGELASVLKDEEGRITLGFKITGTPEKPIIRLDTAPLKQRASQKVKSELTRQLDKLTSRLLPSAPEKEKADSLGPADSLTAADSLSREKKLEQQVPALLKKLFKKKPEPKKE